jgi:hypothetical protein
LEAQAVHDHANSVFASRISASAETSEPAKPRMVPATVAIETSAGVNRPVEITAEQAMSIINKAHRKLVIDEFVKSGRKVRGLDR